MQVDETTGEIMGESPDTIHGRMKEGAHLAGYGLSRAMDNLKWLLEEERYKQLAPGYTNVNEFLRDTAGAFELLRIDPAERKQIARLVKGLQPEASQRAIADMAGVSEATIARDLGADRGATNVAKKGKIEDGDATNVASSTPDTQPWTTDETYDPTEQAKSRKKKGAHVSYNSGENEWYTPPKYIEAARAVMGDIDCDPASTKVANRIVKAETFYTVEDDGLMQDWQGRVWMNPPYAQPLVKHFSKKLVSELNKGVTEACVLVNNATDTVWFHTLLAEAVAVCFIKGRVRFLDRQGNPTGAPLQGQAVLYFGKNRGIFQECFKKFGRVLYAEG